ncbi:MAG: energy transducer TonB [Candidatus Acidiferrum sp.]
MDLVSLGLFAQKKSESGVGIHCPRTATHTKLIKMVKPTYPEPAKKARIEGKVLLRCLIGLDGSAERIEVVTGHELLAQAAKEAVLQWKYEPPKLNVKPVQTDFVVEIIFELFKEMKKTIPSSDMPN